MQARIVTEGYRASNRATGLLVLWGTAWAATLALAKFGPGNLWESQQTAASWAAVVVNLAVGLGWIVAYTRFLGAIDELERKIMLDALAVTLGAGFIGGLGYVVADTAGLVADDVNIGVFFALLGAVFVIAFFTGRIRYR